MFIFYDIIKIYMYLHLQNSERFLLLNIKSMK